MHIGIDNFAVVGKGSQIIKYYDDRERVRRKEERRESKLGGASSRLRRTTPFKQPWRLMNDGDLWEMFAKTVEERGPGSTRVSKVKGHANQEMTEKGKVQKEDKKGNDQADIGVDRGAVTMQRVTQKLADLYSWRHGGYRNLMVRS